MTQLRPCLTCRRRREPCALRDAVKVAISPVADRLRETAPGIRLSGTLSFRCAERLTGYHVGARVRVTLHDHDGYNPSQGEISIYEDHLGYVLSHERGTAGKIVVWLDEETSVGKRRIRLQPHHNGQSGVLPTGDGKDDLPAEEIQRRFEQACRIQRLISGGTWHDDQRGDLTMAPDGTVRAEKPPDLDW